MLHDVFLRERMRLSKEQDDTAVLLLGTHVIGRLLRGTRQIPTLATRPCSIRAQRTRLNGETCGTHNGEQADANGRRMPSANYTVPFEIPRIIFTFNALMGKYFGLGT